MSNRSKGRKRSTIWITAGVAILIVSIIIAVLFQKRPTRLFDRLPVRSNDIVLLGDSHFEFFDAAELLNDKRIRNKGYSGQTSAEMLDRVDEITRARPKKVLLLAGANDAFRGRTLEAYLNDMERLIQELEAAAGDLAVLSIPPTTDRELQQRFDRFNQALEGLCADRGIHFIDIVPALEKNGLLDPALTYDGVHLNTAGYERLVPLLKPYLKRKGT